jgi:peptidoglycan/xylan/chitin deacetylase (PgdA/CDA1 family)
MSLQLRHAAVAERWKPSPTIVGSIGLHCAAGVGAAVEPGLWPWAAGVVAGNHAFLGALGLWPRSTLLGPNLTRLPPASAARHELALTFDDGPDPEVTPRVLDLLDAHHARATFFCIAEHAQRHARTCREIVRRGHAVESHSLTHRTTFALLGLRGFRRDIAQAQAILSDVVGRPPRFFRAPAGLRNPLLDPVLHELGLRLASWTRRGFDTRERSPARVAERLVHRLAPGDILLLHDGGSAPSLEGGAVVLEALPLVLEAARAQGLASVTLRHAIDS